jgi:phage/plasmid-associated DNA primase
LTGGDLRPARALGMPQFVYRPTGIPVISFNRTPKIKDEDDGTRRRLVFFPLQVNLRELPPEQRRSELEVDAALRAELPGILNWLLDGFRDFFARLEKGVGVPPGIDPPEVMLTLKDRIMEAADPVGTFLRECADIEPDTRTRTADFFRAFKAWAKDNGARVFSDSALRDNLSEKGFERSKSHGLMVFRGFKLKDDPLVHQYLETAKPPADDGGNPDDFA